MEGRTMKEKMYVYDISQYEKGIVYAKNEEEAKERVRSHYRDGSSGMNVDDSENFNFYVWEFVRGEKENVVAIVNW